MPRYKVDFYYLATGMEGRADERSYGIIEAESAEAAKDVIVLSEYPEDTFYGPDNKWSGREFFRGCLSANTERGES